jgi:hypothetical protein
MSVFVVETRFHSPIESTTVAIVGAYSTRSALPRPSPFLISVLHRMCGSVTHVTRISRGIRTRCKSSLLAAVRQITYASTTSNSRHHRSSHGPPHLEHRSTRDLADADLQRAIQLSLEEVNSQGQQRRPGYVPYQPDSWQRSEPPLVDHTSRPSVQADEGDDS